MLLKFTKMQGTGNDYIYINGFTCDLELEKKPSVVRFLSDRHFGVGGDGVIFINPSKKADFEMEMYNADGSRGEMCGNGIRCVAKYVCDHGMTDKERFTIESFGQIKDIQVFRESGLVSKVSVDMGEPVLSARLIPVLTEEKELINQPFTAGGYSCRVTCVSMGNPHAVVLIDSLNIDEDIEHMDIEKIGPVFECDAHFPNRVNTEFVSVIDRSNIRMRVWERGTGETLSCGTGCCAAAVACSLLGVADDKVNVRVNGGVIEVFWDKSNNHVYMRGPAQTVFTGEINTV